MTQEWALRWLHRCFLIVTLMMAITPWLLPVGDVDEAACLSDCHPLPILSPKHIAHNEVVTATSANTISIASTIPMGCSTAMPVQSTSGTVMMAVATPCSYRAGAP